MEDIFTYQIPKYLKYKDLEKYCSINENVYNVWKNKIETLKEIYDFFPEHIINMIGEEILSKSVKIDFQDNWLGPTAYLDGVNSEELKNKISYGKDKSDRSFIFLKAKNENYENLALIIFQRYPNSKLFCCIESMSLDYSKADGFFGGVCAVSGNFEEKLKKLFQKGEYISEKNKYVKYFYIKLIST